MTTQLERFVRKASLEAENFQAVMISYNDDGDRLFHAYIPTSGPGGVLDGSGATIAAASRALIAQVDAWYEAHEDD